VTCRPELLFGHLDEAGMVARPGADVFSEAAQLGAPALITLIDLGGAHDQDVDVRVHITVATRRRTEHCGADRLDLPFPYRSPQTFEQLCTKSGQHDNRRGGEMVTIEGVEEGASNFVAKDKALVNEAIERRRDRSRRAATGQTSYLSSGQWARSTREYEKCVALERR